MNKCVKIIAISDTHGFFQTQDFQSLPQADIFIHCGDFTEDCELQELQSFRDILQQIKDIQKVVIPGNHQFIFDQDKQKHDFKEQQIQNERSEFKKVCNFLEFQMIKLKGINILGISKRASYFDWNFDFMPQGGKELFEKYRGKVDILITHWPPYGILDEISKKQRGGSKGLLKFVQQIKPKIHLFGHIHQGYGFKQVDSTKFYNASFLDKQYNPKNKPHFIQFQVTLEKDEK